MLLTFVHDGYTRRALVHVPPSYQGQPTPVVLSFHGRYGTGADQAQLTGFDALSDQHGFIVVYPDGVGRSWNAGYGTGYAEDHGIDDVGFVVALLGQIGAQWAIDAARLYACGMSNGSVFTHRLGCELAPTFAAIAGVAGPMATAQAPTCFPAAPMPTMVIHGTADPFVPYAGGVTDGGGSVLSAPATAQRWSEHNGCTSEPVISLRKRKVTCQLYEGPAPVVLCTVKDGGHTWPGGYQYASVFLIGVTNRDINASELIWEFFAANPKSGV